MPSSSGNNNTETAGAGWAHILQYGTNIKAEGNRPVLLEGPDVFWTVVAGEVDLFAVPMQNGRPAGARTHLFDAGQGAFLFGVPLEPSGQGMGVIAVGKPGTRLTRFDMKTFERGLSDPAFFKAAVSGVDDWLGNISFAITQERPQPATFQDMTVQTKVSYETAEVLRSTLETTWLEQTRGEALLLGDTLLSYPAREYLFPLTKNLWVQSQGPMEIRSFSTSDVLGNGKFQSSLAEFHRVFLQCVQNRCREAEDVERKRLEDQDAKDNSRLRGALFSLGSMLFPESKRSLADISEAPPLLAAAELVAKAAGIQTDMAGLCDTQETGPMTLNDLARECHFYIRRVILKEGWWGGG